MFTIRNLSHEMHVGTQIEKRTTIFIRTIKTLEEKQPLQVMSTRIFSKLIFFPFKMKICLSRTHMNYTRTTLHSDKHHFHYFAVDFISIWIQKYKSMREIHGQ